MTIKATRSTRSATRSTSRTMEQTNSTDTFEESADWNGGADGDGDWTTDAAATTVLNTQGDNSNSSHMMTSNDSSNGDPIDHRLSSHDHKDDRNVASTTTYGDDVPSKNDGSSKISPPNGENSMKIPQDQSESPQRRDESIPSQENQGGGKGDGTRYISSSMESNHDDANSNSGQVDNYCSGNLFNSHESRGDSICRMDSKDGQESDSFSHLYTANEPSTEENANGDDSCFDNNEMKWQATLNRSTKSSIEGMEFNNDDNIEPSQRSDGQLLFQSGATSSSSTNGIAANTTKASTIRNNRHDEYVKRGAVIRALLNTAFRAVASGFASNATSGSSDEMDSDRNMDQERMENEEVTLSGKKRAKDSGEYDDDGLDSVHPKKSWNGRRGFVHAQDLAQEKAEECITLKRKLEESESLIDALQNENSNTQQTINQIQSKMERTLEALQIAGTRAANARAEADAANARSESLSAQLNDLQSAIEETRRGMEVVRREHDDVSRAARSVEGRLIHVESELTRAVRVRKEAEEERDSLKLRAEIAEKEVVTLHEKVDEFHGEIRMLKRDLAEMAELEKVRSDRTHRVESELQEARSTLFEATSAAAEAESTVTSLRNVVEELRKENESLHVQINENRDSLSKDRARQGEALTSAEKEVQRWKMKCEEEEEEIRKLKMENTSSEKQVNQLKSQLSNMERRLNESNKEPSRIMPSRVSSATPTVSDLGLINAFGAKDVVNEEELDDQRKYVVKLPLRASLETLHDSTTRQLTYTSKSSYFVGKENKPNVDLHQSNRFHGGGGRKPSKSSKCCLCLQDLSGMTKSCQCGQLSCDKRAHATCIAKKKKAGTTSVQAAILCDDM